MKIKNSQETIGHYGDKNHIIQGNLELVITCVEKGARIRRKRTLRTRVNEKGFDIKSSIKKKKLIHSARIKS